MESTQEQIAEGESVVRVLAAVLERLVGANSLLAQTDPGKVTKFHALKAPGIGIHQYLVKHELNDDQHFKPTKHRKLPRIHESRQLGLPLL